MRESKYAVMASRAAGWAVCVAALLCTAACGRTESVAVPERGSAIEASLAGLEAVAREFPAVDDRPLRWPSDHAPHLEHFTESWLVAGLLGDEAGRRYGFQLLLQRVALQPADAGERASAWAADAAWQGVFSVEPEGAPRAMAERYSREALGLAGASAATPSAWLEEWRIEINPDTGTGVIRGVVEGFALELSFRLPAIPPAGTAADARRGYWWPGLEVAGTLETSGRALAVRGSALLDRSWGQSPPAGRGQLSLARFWGQGEDGTAVRCEQLRRRGGGGVPLGGCEEWPSGRSLALQAEPTEAAAAAARGGEAPLEWTLDSPDGDAPERWIPLAQPGAATVAWSGVLVPAKEGATGHRWGLLSLSNFAAP